MVIFLDENHCANPHVIAAVKGAGIRCEKHLDHFAAGTDDVIWLPEIGRQGWCLLTTDARIRSNFLEREAVRVNRVRMFYFSRNNLSGKEMGVALVAAIPRMVDIVGEYAAPFTASITRMGDVKVRNTFEDQGS